MGRSIDSLFVRGEIRFKQKERKTARRIERGDMATITKKGGEEKVRINRNEDNFREKVNIDRQKKWNIRYPIRNFQKRRPCSFVHVEQVVVIACDHWSTQRAQRGTLWVVPSTTADVPR